MSVDRTIEIRLVTNLKYFSEVLKVLVDSGYSFNSDGTISTLAENDIDDFVFLKYDSFDDVNKILNKREDKGLQNYIVIWDMSIDDSLIVCSEKLDCPYKGYESQYELTFSIGYGVRVKGAERYTDFSVYISKLLPVFINNSIYVCEVTCKDFDC